MEEEKKKNVYLPQTKQERLALKLKQNLVRRKIKGNQENKPTEGDEI